MNHIVTSALQRLSTAAEDKKDVITLDVPLFIRLLEQSREDIKSDAELHELVERVLSASKQQGDALTMDDYSQLSGVRKATEQAELDNEDNGVDVDQTIIEWFRSNPNPSDPDVHELAGQLGIDPEHLEKHIYRLFTQLLQGQ